MLAAVSATMTTLGVAWVMTLGAAARDALWFKVHRDETLVLVALQALPALVLFAGGLTAGWIFVRRARTSGHRRL